MLQAVEGFKFSVSRLYIITNVLLSAGFVLTNGAIRGINIEIQSSILLYSQQCKYHSKLSSPNDQLLRATRLLDFCIYA